jgi:hypothetical protein
MKRRIILAIILLALLILACGPTDEWIKQQNDVLRRQRENDIDIDLDDLRAPQPRRDGVVACSFAWGG